MIWKRLFGDGKTRSERHGERIVEYTPKERAAPPEDDPADWEPVNPLEEQMAQIPHSVEAQFAFARMLVESEVLLATAAPARQQGERTLERDESFQALGVDDGRGGTAAAVFTSETRLAEALGAGAPYVALNGRAALEAVRETGAMINPGSRGLWTLYDPPTIERILSGNI